MTTLFATALPFVAPPALGCPACAGRDGSSAIGSLWLLGGMIAAPLAIAVVVGLAVHRVLEEEHAAEQER